MKEGLYIKETLAYACLHKPKRRGTTLWAGGPGKLSTCRKCEKCGHSVGEQP